MRYQGTVRAALEKVAYMAHRDDTVRHVLGSQVLEELSFGPTVQLEPGEKIMFHGGIEGIPFEQLGIRIEPLSMERVSQVTMQRRALQMLNLVSTVAPLIPQTPYVQWKDVLGSVGDALNMPNFGDFFDMQLASKFAGVEMDKLSPFDLGDVIQGGLDRGLPSPATTGQQSGIDIQELLKGAA